MMIKDILKMIVDEKITSKREIASRVSIAEGTLDDILNLLQRKGFLKPQECIKDMQPSCQSCPVHASCDPKDTFGKAFFVTEKGRRFILGK